VNNIKSRIAKVFNLDHLSTSAFLWRGVWFSSHIEFRDYTSIYMTNFIESSREGEEKAIEEVEHVDKSQWNGRRLYSMRRNEWSNGMHLGLLYCLEQC
jgi:hypothetical protein